MLGGGGFPVEVVSASSRGAARTSHTWIAVAYPPLGPKVKSGLAPVLQRMNSGPV
jgi:hypothetical protein